MSTELEKGTVHDPASRRMDGPAYPQPIVDDPNNGRTVSWEYGWGGMTEWDVFFGHALQGVASRGMPPDEGADYAAKLTDAAMRRRNQRK